MRVPTYKAGEEAPREPPSKGNLQSAAEIEMRPVRYEAGEGEETPWDAPRDRAEAGAGSRVGGRAGVGAETGSGAC